MRIGIDARLWSESGVGRYTRNLVKFLQEIDKKNEYVLFVLGKDYQEIRSKIKDLRFKIVETNIRWHTIEEQLILPSILNKEKLDLVHFPYFAVPIFYNKPFVVTIHDLILHHFPTGQASTLPFPFYWVKLLGYKFIMHRTVQKSRMILTVSNATKEEIIDHLGVTSEKIVVTYEGIEDSLISKLSPHDEAGKTQNSNLQLKTKSYFLYVGNAYPHKNLDRLVEVFRDGIKNDTCLVLVGKEDFFYKRLKEKIEKMGIERQIVFYGYATEEELTFLYKNAKALIMPSLMEGFGLPVLEAMANKCLVLASDIPVHREIAGDAAIYFDPMSVVDMVKKTEQIHLNDKIHKGFERSKMYTFEKMARQTLDVYESSISL